MRHFYFDRLKVEALNDGLVGEKYGEIARCLDVFMTG